VKSKELSLLGLANTSDAKLTASNMNLMKSQLEGNTQIDELRSFTALECKYLVALMKNRSI